MTVGGEPHAEAESDPRHDGLVAWMKTAIGSGYTVGELAAALETLRTAPSSEPPVNAALSMQTQTDSHRPLDDATRPESDPAALEPLMGLIQSGHFNAISFQNLEDPDQAPALYQDNQEIRAAVHQAMNQALMGGDVNVSSLQDLVETFRVDQQTIDEVVTAAIQFQLAQNVTEGPRVIPMTDLERFSKQETIHQAVITALPGAIGHDLRQAAETIEAFGVSSTELGTPAIQQAARRKILETLNLTAPPSWYAPPFETVKWLMRTFAVPIDVLHDPEVRTVIRTSLITRLADIDTQPIRAPGGSLPRWQLSVTLANDLMTGLPANERDILKQDAAVVATARQARERCTAAGKEAEAIALKVNFGL